MNFLPLFYFYHLFIFYHFLLWRLFMNFLPLMHLPCYPIEFYLFWRRGQEGTERVGLRLYRNDRCAWVSFLDPVPSFGRETEVTQERENLCYNSDLLVLDFNVSINMKQVCWDLVLHVLHSEDGRMTHGLSDLTSLSWKEWEQLKIKRNWDQHIARTFDGGERTERRNFQAIPLS